MCSSECGVLLKKHGKKDVVIVGDNENPMNRGKLCPKAQYTMKLRNAPDRVGYPLKRVGRRGGGRFEPIGWDRLFLEIADKIGEIHCRYGPESMAMLFGEKPDHDPYYLFAKCFGTPNIFDHNSLCDTNRRFGFCHTYGKFQERPLPDLQRPLVTENGLRTEHDCRLLVLFGENPAEARRFLWLWDGIQKAKKNGMKLIVVDPFRTKTAELADHWIQILPGSDNALLFSITRYIIEFDRIYGIYLDRHFIEHHTHGWRAFRDKLMENRLDDQNGLVMYSPEWACQKSGVSPEIIKNLAHEIGSVKPMAAMGGMNGMAHHENGFQAFRMLAALIAVTGNLDVPGGLHLRQPMLVKRYPKINNGKHKDIDGGYPLATQGIVARIPENILNGVKIRTKRHRDFSYSLRSLWVTHGNPLLTAPDTNGWVRAFTATDPVRKDRYLLNLLVVNDIFLHDTAFYADYVLPIAHFLERQGIVEFETLAPAVGLRQKVLPLFRECRSPLEIVKGIAGRMKDDRRFEELMALKTDDDWCNHLLSDLFDYSSPIDELRKLGGLYQKPAGYKKYLSQGFDTPSGKVELISETIVKCNEIHGTNYSSLPAYEEKTPSTFERSSDVFRLITGRSLFHTHSLTQNVSNIKDNCPFFLMNNEDAEKHDIRDGMNIEIENGHGWRVKGIVKISSYLRQGVIRARYGWGGRSPFLENIDKKEHFYNINLLTDASMFDPLTGNSGFGDVYVRLT
jgi:thiosulfate reductase/polysulfide reductase chain A